jgi:hypothetical protein
MNLNLLYHLLDQKKREQQAQALSLGQGDKAPGLQQLIQGNPRYERYMDQLYYDDLLGNKDQRTFNKIEKDVGPMPDYFQERYWLNQIMQQRQQDLFKKYKGGI